MLSMTYIQQHYNEQIQDTRLPTKRNFITMARKMKKIKLSLVALEQQTNYRILYSPTI
jgi:hypothetical protein